MSFPAVPHSVGDQHIGDDGRPFVCTHAGSPGVWRTDWDLIRPSASVASVMTGEFVFSVAESPADHLFEMNGQTLAGGVATYAGLSAQWPGWVSAADIVLPDWRGRALMALGALGITGAAGDTYEDQNKQHRHIGGGPVYGAEAAFGSTTGGGGNGGVANWDGSSPTRPWTSNEGGDEARPNSVGLILCIRAKGAVKVTNGDGTAGQTLVSNGDGSATWV